MPPPAEAFTGVLAVTLCGADGVVLPYLLFKRPGVAGGAEFGPPYMGAMLTNCAKILRGENCKLLFYKG